MADEHEPKLAALEAAAAQTAAHVAELSKNSFSLEQLARLERVTASLLAIVKPLT